MEDQRTRFGSLMIALSKRQVLEGFSNARHRDIEPHLWANPVFDFGGLVNEAARDDRWDELIAIMDHGDGCSFPFPEMTICCTLQYKDGSAWDFVFRVKIHEAEVPPRSACNGFLRKEGDVWRYIDSRMRNSLAKTIDTQVSTSILLLRAYFASTEVISDDTLIDLTRLNKQRRMRAQEPLPPVRTIHISDLRRIYERKSSEPQGGTHARPRRHVRTITDRWIHPTPGKRQFRPYQREAKVVEINRETVGPPVITRVKL